MFRRQPKWVHSIHAGNSMGYDKIPGHALSEMTTAATEFIN
jgi:hypothetical protein